MSRKTAMRVLAAAAVIFLLSGVFQLARDFSLGWAAIIAAGVIAAGLAMARRTRWGGLIATWGVIVGRCWVLALIWGVMGRGYDYPYAGLGPGIGIATASFLGNRRDSRAERKDSDTRRKSPDRHQ